MSSSSMMGRRAHESQRDRIRYREALEHLASIDLIELCNEAKVEHCRATRDLRSCGRNVQHVLSSCRHASLCAECSQRCELCPICRIPIPKSGDRLRLRLFNECIEAGLIPKRYDAMFQEKEDNKKLAIDVERLYSLFDVALENNLVSLICHYVTDVCMDESAVSSDPVIAFLLDEVVVKDWCQRTFGNIVSELKKIYILEVEEMKIKLSSLLKFSSQLTGISNVLEVLESSVKVTLSAQHDLHHLQENVLKAKQHLEIMIWCIRHQFLLNFKSRYSNHTSWSSRFRERRSAAVTRSWPDLISKSAESSEQSGSSLFIEDALSNLEGEKGYEKSLEKDAELNSLAKDGGTSSFFRCKIDGFIGCYPFENLRDASDILFLCGSSDLVVAKRAIFLYYLIDRHWTMPDEKWRHIIDDFAASFGINRHSVLESLTFYLLDDYNDEALREACHILPEVASTSTHPKIAQVLLERKSPETALMVLQWSGLEGLSAFVYSDHGGAKSVSLCQAVTSVRVRIECGLLTEAFMYQRAHCQRVKEEQSKHAHVLPNELVGTRETWADQIEALVAEICCLCIQRNLVDRMIELPWNSDEEKYLHKCLSDYATEDPSAPSGSLLVVYYLQRFRYIEAYQFNNKLECLEKDFISKNAGNEEVILRIRSTSQWRAGLVDQCIKLLPEVQQQQLKTGHLSDSDISPVKDVGVLSKSNLPGEELHKSSSILSPMRIDSLLNGKALPFGTPTKLTGAANSHFEHNNNYHSPSILHGRFLTQVEGTFTSYKENSVSRLAGIRKNFDFDDTPFRGDHLASPPSNTRLKGNRSSSRLLQKDRLLGDNLGRVSVGKKAEWPIMEADYSRQPSPLKFSGLSNELAEDMHPAFSGKRGPDDRSWIVNSADDSMDFSWSNGNGVSAVEDNKMNGGPRWRSDETSEEEDEQSPGNLISKVPSRLPTRGTRRIRSSRR
ncbi:hypothetical protein Scep_026888 [Stephania cephalantha]|uniref:ELYS-like domain-containing protein n=1 Tax=Stephania cephalantha TaxID=152367 RepID=A0AAP0ELG0_9MAGN